MQIARIAAVALLIFADAAIPALADQGGGVPALADRVARLEAAVTTLNNNVSAQVSQLQAKIVAINSSLGEITTEMSQLGNVYTGASGQPQLIQRGLWQAVELALPAGDYLLHGVVDSTTQINGPNHFCRIQKKGDPFEIHNLPSADGPTLAFDGFTETRLVLLEALSLTEPTILEIDCDDHPTWGTLVALRVTPIAPAAPPLQP